jgi:FMN reductase
VETVKILGISGSLTGEKTSIGVYEVLMAIKAEDPEAETELLDLKDYEVEFARGFPLSYYNDDTIAAVNKMLEADILVFGSPIYQASITGALKNLLDHLHRDAFQSKVCGIVMNGGSDKHFLVAEYQLKPVLTFLKATCAVRNVFIHNDDFNEDNEIINADIQARIRKLAHELLQLRKAFSGGNPGNLG